MTHLYHLRNWWDLTKFGETVQTLWMCARCGETKLHVTPEDWRTPCPGTPEGGTDSTARCTLPE
jgi:hypothetical protein